MMEVPVLLTVFGLLVALAGMVLPFVVVGGLLFYLYRRRRMSRVAREAAQTWAETIGVVVSSTIKVQRTVRSRSEVPIVLYQYQVDGTSYLGKSIRAGDQFFAIRFAGDAREIVERYPAGAQVTVYYYPADPAQAALER
jgi:hypothetical protein